MTTDTPADTADTPIPLPTTDGAVVVAPAPGNGPGNWSGAASAITVDGVTYLTYRVRRPLTEGRGVSVVVARSTDGEHFETVCEVDREPFGAESFEKPCLVPLADGRWRLYLSCATPNSKHWWVDSLTADTIEGLPGGERAVAHAGDETVGVKDPVVVREGDHWRMWLCCHPLTEPGHEDRMTTRLLTSTDGLDWTDRGVVLAPCPGQWDARGARVTTEVSGSFADGTLVVLYDGRPTAQDNWYETTGAARWDGERLSPIDGARARSPYSDGALRYATAVPAVAGRTRYYVEAARPDGAHDLITVVV